MVRIKDIAKTCGVSTATVSYVIHGKHEKVSKEVRERIEAEIAETGYITNQSAINLVSRCSGLIGVAVMNTSEKKDIMGDPYFSILFSYLEKEFSQAFISRGSKEPRSALESRRVSLGAHWVDPRESSLLRRLERGGEIGL